MTSKELTAWMREFDLQIAFAKQQLLSVKDDVDAGEQHACRSQSGQEHAARPLVVLGQPCSPKICDVCPVAEARKKLS